MPEWPKWWNYDLSLSSHVVERMQDRGFSELDLRAMLDDAIGLHPSITAGRFVIVTHHLEELWEVVVEPDESAQVLIVVTAYGVE